MCTYTQTSGATVTVIASEKTWIEDEAIQQLKTTAALKGMKKVVGLPDLHPGRGTPIGAAFMSKSWIYPHLVGNDIGCGMGLWKTDLPVHKLKLDTWVSKLDNLDESWEGDTSEWLSRHQLESTLFDHSLGTIGGGNHFAELQKIESVLDEDVFEALDLSTKHFYVLVHSGSRGLGEFILRNHRDAHAGVLENSPEAIDYLTQHNMAVKWAGANRALIAHRFLSCLKGEGSQVLDVFHNTVEPYSEDNESYWLHRKGATPADQGLVVIPGSRGSFSYLVMPTGSQVENAYSLAHGAGRKWKRTDAKSKLSKFRMDDFTHTDLGSRVICEDKDLIFEEAPQAYKKIDSVIGDLVTVGIIKVIAILRPVITYKTRRGK
jgi:release factor H-coupled RctB family protein